MGGFAATPPIISTGGSGMNGWVSGLNSVFSTIGKTFTSVWTAVHPQKNKPPAQAPPSPAAPATGGLQTTLLWVAVAALAAFLFWPKR